LALVSGLTLGDYLLWNWSLNHSHDVLALISGLTLPPLALAWLWLLALSVARLLARSTRRSPLQQAGRRARTAGGRRLHARRSSTAAPDGASPDDASPTAAPSPAPSSRKIAA
jgi:hypothetical protein